MENSNFPVFSDALTFINWVESQKRFSKKTSLDKMFYLSSLLDNPHQKFKTIHVTGTNGKGSVVASLKSIYLNAGLHVGTFTSPYIVCFNERITYDGKFISDVDLVKYANIITSKYPDLIKAGYELPTFFEFITMLAFVYFASKSELDIAIIEVGIGGRLDATNIINPLVSVITNVSYDHMSQLGETLELITNEKLGIVKKGAPLVTGTRLDNLYSIMDKRCKSLDSKCVRVDFEKLKIEKMDLDGSKFSYKEKKDVLVKLLGNHQIENACIVIEVVNIINNLSKTLKSNLYITDELLYEGLIKVEWPGRLERVCEEPLIYLDGGHNIGCIERICEFIDSINFPIKRAVISISDDKEKETMIKMLDKTFDELIFTKYTYKRSAESSSLYDLSNAKSKLLISDINDCVKYVYDNPVSFTLFIGSLYLVSEIRPLFLNKKN